MKRSDPLVSWYKFRRPLYKRLADAFESAVERLICHIGHNLPERVKDVVIRERGGTQLSGITYFNRDPNMAFVRTGENDFEIGSCIQSMGGCDGSGGCGFAEKEVQRVGPYSSGWLPDMSRIWRGGQ